MRVLYLICCLLGPCWSIFLGLRIWLARSGRLGSSHIVELGLHVRLVAVYFRVTFCLCILWPLGRCLLKVQQCVRWLYNELTVTCSSWTECQVEPHLCGLLWFSFGSSPLILLINDQGSFVLVTAALSICFFWTACIPCSFWRVVLLRWLKAELGKDKETKSRSIY